jgi:hypothetical protein
MKKRNVIGIAAALQMTLVASTASAVVIDFAGGTATLQNGSTVVTSDASYNEGIINYVEDGVLVEFNGLIDSWGSFIGDYYGYQNSVIHTHWDSLQSVTFSMMDGSSFDLNYMDVTSNTVFGGGHADGIEDSWVTASNGTTIKLPSANWGSIEEPERLWLSSDFDNITSFTVTSNNAYCFGLDNFYINEPPPINPDAPDTDEDGVIDSEDNCLMAPNPDQSDADSDGMGNVCDTCPHDPDNDLDADGICSSQCGEIDNCPDTANPDQNDADSDGMGDACDDDDDNDGVPDTVDNCQYDPNSDQADQDQDGAGDACDTDSDGDNIIDADDKCLGTNSGDTIDSDGCSIDQLCPCANDWMNHGGYVKCVAHSAKDFLAEGLITIDQKQDYVSEAARSQCGHKKPKRSDIRNKNKSKKNLLKKAKVKKEVKGNKL